jgi:hypothetical protein
VYLEPGGRCHTSSQETFDGDRGPGVPPVWDLFLKEISVIVGMDTKP